MTPAGRIVLLAPVLICLLAAVAEGTESIRFRGRLVTVGDSKLQLLRVLGQPDFREVLTYGLDVGRAPEDRDPGHEPRKVELWYYLDLNSLDWEIRLENSRITDIEWER